MEKLWTTTEVASFLQVKEADVEQFVKQGKLTGYKLGGQFLRFRPDQVKALKDVHAASQAAAVQMPFSQALPAGMRKDGFAAQLRDFFYFYDFYLISALLLAILVIYLVASGG